LFSVKYDNDMVPTHTSQPFYFIIKGIEYVCGMTLSHNNEDVIVGLGHDDCEAYTVHYKLDDVLSTLKPLTSVLDIEMKY